MKILFPLALILISSLAFGEDVIDLGSIEIGGEMRRPMITYSGSSQGLVKALNTSLTQNTKDYSSALQLDRQVQHPSPGEFSFTPISREL